MEAKDIPFFAALIFPGFFAIQAFFWATNSREMSDVNRIVWSFIYSVPTFFGLHAIYRVVVRIDADSLPSPQVIAGNAGEAPIWFLVSLYGAALLAGYLAGQVWHGQYLDRALSVIGLDLRRHRDVLTQSLAQGSHVDVKLDDGTFLRGWPFLYSTEEAKDRFIFLTKVKRRLKNNSWSDSQNVVIPVSRIERLYFIDPRRPLDATSAGA